MLFIADRTKGHEGCRKASLNLLACFARKQSAPGTLQRLSSHKGPMRGYYPYEIERKKGSYFPILGSIVVINQAIEFLETYGLLRN